jgi:hypothetical protein
MKNLETLDAQRNEYDPESQAFIDSLKFAQSEIGSINAMRATEGWKLIEKKIREELEQRIMFLVKDDLKITTLLALLTVADTKTLAKALQEEINKIIPE